MSIPLRQPARISTRDLFAREYVLVKIQTDEGVDGVGYIYAGTKGATIVALMVNQFCTPLLVGQDPSMISKHWASIYQEMLLLGRRGAGLRALSCVDIALWDLMGKKTGLPLYQLLGGHRSTVPAYASGGYYREGKDLQGLADELARYQVMGFSDFKIKVGGVSIQQDVERVRVARETIGKDARLAIDANNAYTSVPEAVRAIEAFSKFDIWWFEEPLSPDYVDGHAQVARRTTVPIATGEIEATRFGFHELITKDAALILQADAGVLGGITEWLRVAHTASTFGIEVAPHWHANLHIHLVGAVSNALTVEYFVPEEDIYNFEEILLERLRPIHGQIEIPNRPGIGLVLDDGAVERYTIH
ncbi:racemase [Alicyclobacillus acidoterrestris]|uniref:mandelate racemase/muconate lactonizing enzyme family protein n=1 Tax=Alicyclobacillus suci TaxID=2816080 RepID=UPI001196B86C|nr:mandelate racemase/muconate lactonizing enzyme family protein [Alicyclobacillus suci]GEO24486.1 racemase [Alicyclobacillus acidoterrestris]